MAARPFPGLAGSVAGPSRVGARPSWPAPLVNYPAMAGTMAGPSRYGPRPSWPLARPGRHYGRPPRKPVSPALLFPILLPSLPNHLPRVSPPLEGTQASPPPLLSIFSHPPFQPLPKSETPRPDLPLHPSDFLHWCGDLEISQVLGGCERPLSLPIYT